MSFSVRCRPPVIKLITKEVHFCDVCGRKQYISRKCRKCGAEMCSHCWETHGTTYPLNVYFSNGNDGHYCNLCDSKLSADRSDPLHAAYLKVQELRLELERWNADFTAQTKDAEEAVRALSSAEARIVLAAKPKNISVVRRFRENFPSHA